MINQLLDDPKLTATKYREWKVMNTLLIQDIYHQQQDPPADPEGPPQGRESPPSSASIENSIWEQARVLSPPDPEQHCKMLQELTFFLQRKTETSSSSISSLSKEAAHGEDQHRSRQDSHFWS